jgi:N-methylhydantoinase A
VKTPLYDRSALLPGDGLMGPAVIADSGSTTFIHPDMNFKIDGYGNIIIMV